MRFPVSLALVAMLALPAEAQQYNVRTMAAPNVSLTKFHSFHLLPTPHRHDGARKSGAYDPMVSSSITNRALWATVGGELEALGYTDSEWMPDFVVAIYATTHEHLDLGMWPYGYHYSPRWWQLALPESTSALYPEGTVIVDVVNPETLDVLWRGAASIAVDHDPLENAKRLMNAAAAIVDKFPHAKPVIVAGGVKH